MLLYSYSNCSVKFLCSQLNATNQRRTKDKNTRGTVFYSLLYNTRSRPHFVGAAASIVMKHSASVWNPTVLSETKTNTKSYFFKNKTNCNIDDPQVFCRAIKWGNNPLWDIRLNITRITSEGLLVLFYSHRRPGISLCLWLAS